MGKPFARALNDTTTDRMPRARLRGAADEQCVERALRRGTALGNVACGFRTACAGVAPGPADSRVPELAALYVALDHRSFLPTPEAPCAAGLDLLDCTQQRLPPVWSAVLDRIRRHAVVRRAKALHTCGGAPPGCCRSSRHEEFHMTVGSDRSGSRR